MNFDSLQFKATGFGTKQAKVRIGKYELSVILEEGRSLYEAAVFDEGSFIRLPNIHPYDDDVIPGLTTSDVSVIINKLQKLEVT